MRKFIRMARSQSESSIIPYDEGSLVVFQIPHIAGCSFNCAGSETC